MSILPADFQRPFGGGAWPMFGKPHELRCDTGRSALQLALQDWVSRRNHRSQARVWVPSYDCPSVNAALDQAGIKGRPYADQPGMAKWLDGPEPDECDLVIVVHYFGLVNRAAVSWLDAHLDRRWSLLEDCVQAPYTAGAGNRGDYAIASLRKWWPAPDGALVAAKAPMRTMPLLPSSEAFVSRRLAAQLLRGQAEYEATTLKWIEESECLLDNAPPREPSWTSCQLLAGDDVERACDARRRNWSVLASGLKDHARVRPLFAELAPTETPLAFPVLVGNSDRDALRRYVATKGIFCPIHWRLPADASEDDLSLSRRVLSLPLDQRYEIHDMQFVISCVEEFFCTEKP